MHRIELGQIIRDAEIAHAISPLVRRHRLTEGGTEQALLELHVPWLQTLPKSASR